MEIHICLQITQLKLLTNIFLIFFFCHDYIAEFVVLRMGAFNVFFSFSFFVTFLHLAMYFDLPKLPHSLYTNAFASLLRKHSATAARFSMSCGQLTASANRKDL